MNYMERRSLSSLCQSPPGRFKMFSQKRPTEFAPVHQQLLAISRPGKLPEKPATEILRT